MSWTFNASPVRSARVVKASACRSSGNECETSGFVSSCPSAKSCVTWAHALREAPNAPCTRRCPSVTASASTPPGRPEIPSSTTVPPRRASATAVAAPSALPAASKTRSKPGSGREVAPRRQPVHELRRDAEELRERAGVCEARFGVRGGAEIRPAFAAAGAGATGAEALRDDGVADDHAGDLLAGRLDDTRPLVARDDRVAHVRGRPAPVEQLDVGAADTGGPDAYENLAASRP